MDNVGINSVRFELRTKVVTTRTVNFICKIGFSIRKQPSSASFFSPECWEMQIDDHLGLSFRFPSLKKRAGSRLSVAVHHTFVDAVTDDEAQPESQCLLQAFTWTSNDVQNSIGKSWYEVVLDKVQELSTVGFTDILLPPSTKSIDKQG